MTGRWALIVAGAACALVALVLLGRRDPGAPVLEAPAVAVRERRPGERPLSRRTIAAVRAGERRPPRPVPPRSGNSGAPEEPAEARVIDRPVDPALSDHDIPAAGSPGTYSGDELADELAGEKSDVIYDGGADRVFDTGSQVALEGVGEINREAGTISFWIEPQWEAGSEAGGEFVRLGENGMNIAKEGNVLRFQYTDANGQVHGGSAEIGDWQPGEWHHVAATWRGNTLSLFIDGGQLFMNTPPSPPSFADAFPVYVGTSTTGPVAVGQLSYLKMLNRDLTGEEVREIFESGGAPED